MSSHRHRHLRQPGVPVSGFAAWAHAFPRQSVSNAEYLERARWPVSDPHALARESRMHNRLWCGPDENTWTMAREAIAKLFHAEPDLREQIDVVLVASGTTMPVLHPPEADNAGVADLAPLVLRELGRTDALGMDIKACYCTGFLRGVQTMDALLARGDYRAGLVIATEQGSRFSVAESNRSGFCYIMSDAAGAAVMRPHLSGPRGGLIDSVGFTDASKHSWVGIGADAASTVMRGGQAGPATLQMLVEAARALMDRSGLTPAQIDWLVPIQTHAGLVDALVGELGWPREKLIWRGDQTGFSGSASIPSAISASLESKVISRGELILSVAVGAGMNCAGALFHC
jgi:3-oxoacyl-[acyl-carrier-protein] synthase-3